MFAWKRDSADISEDEPIFQARYLGCAETSQATGNGCTTVPLLKLWTGHDLRSFPKITVQISTRGLYMYYVDKALPGSRSSRDPRPPKASDRKHGENWPSGSSRFFSLEDISYCAADQSVDDRLFCWVCKNGDADRLDLHAALCSCKEKAQTMAAVLARSFHHAYRLWQTDAKKVRTRHRDTVMDARGDNPCLALSFQRRSSHVTGSSQREERPADQEW